nr:hypothetical protein [Tanacetum cinerariifolium]
MSGLVTHDLEGHEFEVWDRDCMMVVKEIVNRLLEEGEKSLNGGLSKTLVMKEKMMKKVKVVLRYEDLMI